MAVLCATECIRKSSLPYIWYQYGMVALLLLHRVKSLKFVDDIVSSDRYSLWTTPLPQPSSLCSDRKRSPPVLRLVGALESFDWPKQQTISTSLPDNCYYWLWQKRTRKHHGKLPAWPSISLHEIFPCLNSVLYHTALRVYHTALHG